MLLASSYRTDLYISFPGGASFFNRGTLTHFKGLTMGLHLWKTCQSFSQHPTESTPIKSPSATLSLIKVNVLWNNVSYNDVFSAVSCSTTVWYISNNLTGLGS